MHVKPKSLVCFLMGPTASGKTALAIELIKHLPCKIISVDSGLVYRGMDIGTAKPSTEEQAVAPHRLIDIRDPRETYSAGQFRQDALREINSIIAEGYIPLLVGGTMLYFRVLEQGITDLPSADAAVRAKIAAEADACGISALYQKLQEIDPALALQISANDKQRIFRALEIYELTGKPLSELHKAKPAELFPFKILPIAIAPALRSRIWERVEKRFYMMLQQGFENEVAALYERGDLHENMSSMRAVGYRQMWEYLAGKVSQDECYEKIKIATRQLAKRQLTWLRSWNNLNWFDSEEVNLVEKVLKFF